MQLSTSLSLSLSLSIKSIIFDRINNKHPVKSSQTITYERIEEVFTLNVYLTGGLYLKYLNVFKTRKKK